MNGCVLKQMMAQGTPPLKWKGKRLEWISWWKYFFVFIKRKDKRYRYEDKLGLKKIATILWQRCQKACWYFLTQTKRFRKRTELLL
jgi:hypothetical protein